MVDAAGSAEAAATKARLDNALQEYQECISDPDFDQDQLEFPLTSEQNDAFFNYQNPHYNSNTRYIAKQLQKIEERFKDDINKNEF